MQVLKHRSKGLGTVVLFVALLSTVALGGCSRSPAEKEAKALAAGKKYLALKDYAAAIVEFRNANKALPKDPEPLYQSALAYLGLGDEGSAVASLQKAVINDPKHVGSQLELATLMTVDARPDLLRAVETRLTELSQQVPANMDVLQALANVQIGLGKLDEAEATLAKVLQVEPDHVKANMSLALLEMARDKPEAAERQLKRAGESDPKSADPVVALGRFYTLRGRLDEARAAFEHALQLDDKQPAALMGLGAILTEKGEKDAAAPYYKRLASLPDQQYRQAYVNFLVQTGDQAAALRELERVVNDNPKDADARVRLARAYVEQKRPKDAEKVIADSLYRNAKDSQALLFRAEMSLGEGRLQEAETDLNKLLVYHPESAQAHFLLAQIQQKRGNPLTQRQELTEALSRDPQLIEARIDLAAEFLAGKAPRNALEVLDAAPAEQKGNVGLLVQRNAAMLLLGNRAEARQGIDRGLAVRRIPDLLVQDGYLRLQQRDYKGAVSSFEEALKQAPEALAPLEGIANAYTAQQQPGQAIARIQRQAAAYPNSSELQQFLGQSLAQSGDRGGARQALMAAKAADPSLTEADFDLVRLDIAEGKQDSARKRLQDIIQSGRSEVDARLMLGMLEGAAGNASQATLQYRKAVELDSRNILALNNLAFHLAGVGQTDEALKYAESARELSANSLAAIDDTLGWIYYKKGIYKTAVQYMESAVKKDKTARRVYHLSMARLKLGDLTAGERDLAIARGIDSSIPEALEAATVRAEARGSGK